MDALAAGHDAAVQMIDISVMRVHQRRSRGGLTSKIHAVEDTNGLPVHLARTPGEAHDNRLLFGSPQNLASANEAARGSRL